MIQNTSATDHIVVTLLGTGVPTPNVDRRGASLIIKLGQNIVMVDCGAGALYRLLESDADVHAISHVLLTHLHSDHITGLTDFLWAGWVGHWWTTEPPVIIGPPGTAEFIERLLGAFHEDIQLRSQEGATNRVGITPKIVEVSDGWIFKYGQWHMSAIGVDHRPVKDALGFRFDYAGRSVVVSGDTKKCDNLILHARDADLLIHEVVWGEGMRNAISKAQMPQRARLERIFSYHTPSIEVGEIANLANVKHLVLTHLILAGGTPGDLVADVRQSFSGHVTVGEDLASFTI